MTEPELLSPIKGAPSDSSDAEPQPGVALCLSGGGYRAMLFHLGTLWRLNDAGYLPRLNRISSVSGGSITAGMLGLAWSKLAFDNSGVAQRFRPEVVDPIRNLAERTIDIWAVLGGLIGPGRAGSYITRAYRKHLFGNATLQNLPSDPGPRFVINATNIQSGVLWRFSKPYARDYRVGEIANPTIELAAAVSASSAFPPFLSPVVLHFEESAYSPHSGTDLQRPPYTTRVYLTDGGVYDNLGLETAWKRYKTILVSDGGGYLAAEERPSSMWPLHAYRVLNMINNDVGSLRKRQVITAYTSDPASQNYRLGAYWGIRTNITEYELPTAMKCPFEKTTVLANTATRLAHLDAARQEQLVNWGFAVCDAAIRKHVDPALPTPKGFPYPAVGVG